MHPYDCTFCAKLQTHGNHSKQTPTVFSNDVKLWPYLTRGAGGGRRTNLYDR